MKTGFSIYYIQFLDKIIYKTFDDSPDRGYWDQSILKEILPNEGILPDGGCILIVPGRQNADRVNEVNKYIQDFKWLILIISGDEENDFPIEGIKHTNIKIYQQTPRDCSDFVDRYIPNGYSPPFPLVSKDIEKDLRWFFAGQVTHKRRIRMNKILDRQGGGVLVATKGFTQGLPVDQYVANMLRAKVVPCPSGPITPDTFRLYEALECGAFPIVDKSEYWEMLFDDFPVVQIESEKDLVGHINYFNDTYPVGQNLVNAWWVGEKMKMKEDIIEDVESLTGETIQNQVTILIPTSPIKSHPDTSLIEKAIANVREKFPDEKIIIMIDGVRDEQEELTKNYQEYIRRLLIIVKNDGNILPILFKGHTHQVEMTRKALERVKTPNILFLEHDTYLVEELPVNVIFYMLGNNLANVVRLNHESEILKDHKHLTLNETLEVNGALFTKTAQWSQRPHFAKTGFYRLILNKYFSKGARCMIEDGVHGYVANAYRVRGKVGWNQFKVWLYTPKGDQKRSDTNNGRGDEPKYDELFIY